MLTIGRRLLGARDTAFGSAGTLQGKIFTLALYYLVHNEHTYYVYESARHPDPGHASTWAWNPAAEFGRLTVAFQRHFVPEALHEAQDWLARHQAFWTGALDQLDRLLAEGAGDEP
jgi:hypothetical protein